MANPQILATQSNDPSFSNVWEELQWRGLINQSTDEVELKRLLTEGVITYYCGFDPTAPSLHLGNLVQILLLRRLPDDPDHPDDDRDQVRARDFVGWGFSGHRADYSRIGALLPPPTT